MGEHLTQHFRLSVSRQVSDAPATAAKVREGLEDCGLDMATDFVGEYTILKVILEDTIPTAAPASASAQQPPAPV